MSLSLDEQAGFEGILNFMGKLSREGMNPKEGDLDLRKTQLALKLGTISEILSRTLAKMKSKGVIDVRKNRIRILTRKALEEMASAMKL